MSYLRHVRSCNAFEASRFVPLRVGGARVGLIRRDRLAILAEYPAFFEVDESGVAFWPHLSTRAAVSGALAETAAGLAARRLIPALRGELFSVALNWGGSVLGEIDRAAVPFFGIRSYGVHVNGLRDGDAGTNLWIGRRARDKQVAPGKLDNMVAGGIASGYSAFATVVKEAAEEASVPEPIARRARSVGAIRYRMEETGGIRDDVLFVYDLALPSDFQPVNSDGEIEDFRLLGLDDCLQRVAAGDDFKFNVNLVLIDLAIRRGVIGPDHPEFLALVQGLRGGLNREPDAGADIAS